MPISEVYNIDCVENMKSISDKHFDLAVVDPPWQKRKGGLRKSRPNQNRNLDYETMPTSDIFSLLDKDIFPLAEDDHCVFMWTVDQYFFDCEQEMIKRGYKRHCRFIWNKLNGVAPAFTVRYSHEYLIWFYKGKLLPIAKEQRGKFMTVFDEKSREHSRKPDFCYKMIDALYPNLQKMDVFSRERRTGWRQYGNQCDYFEKELIQSSLLGI